MNFKTREEWLDAAAEEMREAFFAPRSLALPQTVRCSCGFPRGKRTVVGQCWHPDNSADKSVNIFVSPTQAEPVRVLDILLHELCHAALGPGVRHKAPFAKLAREVGLAGKPTATIAEAGSPLWTTLTEMSGRLGPYPHGQLSDSMTPEKEGRGGRTESVKLVSVNEPKYTFRLSGVQYAEHGAPTDPWGDLMVPEDQIGLEQ